MCCECGKAGNLENWTASTARSAKAENRTTRYRHLLRVQNNSPGRNTSGDRGGGFSLIEIMVVIVILALLAGIVGINAKSYIDKANQKKARADIAVFVTAAKSFYTDNGRYPTSSEGLEVLAPEYIDQVSLDPWDNSYQFEVPGVEGAFDIICFGADGAEGGEGIDQDLTNWNNNAEKQE
jgi:general secretion pathway protein G